MCAAAAALGRAGAELPGDLVVLAVPNHFEGGEGTRKALRDGLHADAAIVCEPTDLAVVTGQRGILYLEVTVRGRAAHTTALQIGVNAIGRAARVVGQLSQMTLHDAAGAPVDAEPMVNVAMIEGGLVHNIVPELCKLTVDIRFPPEQTAADVLRDVREAVAAANDDLRPSSRRRSSPRRPAFATPAARCGSRRPSACTVALRDARWPPPTGRPSSAFIRPGPTLRSSTRRGSRRSPTARARWTATGMTSLCSSTTISRRCGRTASPLLVARPRRPAEPRNAAGSSRRPSQRKAG